MLQPFNFEEELRRNFENQRYSKFQTVDTNVKSLADKFVKGPQEQRAIKKLREHIREEIEAHRGEQMKTRDIRDFGYGLKLSYYRIAQVMRQEFESIPGTKELFRGCWLIGK